MSWRPGFWSRVNAVLATVLVAFLVADGTALGSIGETWREAPDGAAIVRSGDAVSLPAAPSDLDAYSLKGTDLEQRYGPVWASPRGYFRVRFDRASKRLVNTGRAPVLVYYWLEG